MNGAVPMEELKGVRTGDKEVALGLYPKDHEQQVEWRIDDTIEAVERIWDASNDEGNSNAFDLSDS